MSNERERRTTARDEKKIENIKDNFQCSLFLRITTLLSWLKSTLLLKNKCFGTTIYMKTQCLQTKRDAALLGKENAWEAKRRSRKE